VKINLTLDVDPSDHDASDSTGLTAEAHDRLCDALTDAGLSIESGPDQLRGEGAPRVELTLVVDDDHDVDRSNTTGLTRDAHDHLMSVITRAGMSVRSGPSKVAP
jgi:hypothetical protein